MRAIVCFLLAFYFYKKEILILPFCSVAKKKVYLPEQNNIITDDDENLLFDGNDTIINALNQVLVVLLGTSMIK
jgi:hypothetical protein